MSKLDIETTDPQEVEAIREALYCNYSVGIRAGQQVPTSMHPFLRQRGYTDEQIGRMRLSFAAIRGGESADLSISLGAGDAAL